MNEAVLLGDDRDGVGIPFHQPLTLLHDLAFIGQNLGAVGDTVLRLHATRIIEQLELGGAAHDHRHAVGIDDHGAVLDPHLGVERRLDRGLLGTALHRAADVEGAHGELGARFADRLGGDDADRLADIDHGAASQVAAIALAAKPDGGFASQHRTDDHRVYAGTVDQFNRFLVDQAAGLNQHLAVQGIDNVDCGGATQDAVGQGRDHFAALDHGAHGEALGGAAIDLGDDGVLRHVHQAAGQVARIRRLQGGVGQTLARAVRRIEVFEHGQAFLEVRDDRRLDDFARGLGHQTAHAGQLLDLRRRAAGAGIGHHPDRVDGRAGIGRADDLHHLLGHLLGAARPDVDHLVVFLALGDEAVEILLLVFLHLDAGGIDQLVLGLRDDQVVFAEGDTGLTGLLESQRHQPIAEDHRLLLATVAVDLVDDVGDLLLGEETIHQIEADVRIFGQNFRQHHAAGRGQHRLIGQIAVGVAREAARADAGRKRNRLGFERALDLGRVAEIRYAVEGDAFLLPDLLEVGKLARLQRIMRVAAIESQDVMRLDRLPQLLDGAELDLGPDPIGALERDVIKPQDDVLRGHDDRLAVGGREDVVGRHHQHAGFELRFERQRHVNRHLVAVEIGVEGGADQRMQLDRLALDQDRLEGLDAEAVERRCAIQEHRMLADDFLENIPNLGTLLLDHALGRLDRAGEAIKLELGIDEGLEELQSHLLRQAALMELEFGSHHDDRAAGIIDALAQQVLAEAALLALKHVGERLQRPLVGAGDDAAAPAVVEQCVHRLLQHALLVAHDDVGRAQFDEPLQPVVAIDDAAVKVVQIGGRETAAIQGHQRAQLGWDHGHDLENHPFRPAVRLDESLDDLEALHQLLAFGLGSGVAQLLTELGLLLFEIDGGEHLLQRLGADRRLEGFVAMLLLCLHEILFVEDLVKLQGRQTRLGDDIALEIKHLFEILERHVDQQADARG